jgi:hypothetical protein
VSTWISVGRVPGVVDPGDEAFQQVGGGVVVEGGVVRMSTLRVHRSGVTE